MHRDLHKKEQIDVFESLVRSIIYQQLAPAAASKILDRLMIVLGVKTDGTSSNTAISPDIIRESNFQIKYIDGKKKICLNSTPTGLSESKMKALQSLAEHFSSDSLLKNVNFYELGKHYALSVCIN